MKSIYLLFASLCFSMMLQAQVYKQVKGTAGNLKNLLTIEELATVTYLEVYGTIDARDFKTIRDEMPALSFLGIWKVHITSYSGNDGTMGYNSSYYYPANEIPMCAFFSSNNYQGKTSLEGIGVPKSVNSIGYSAFQNCTSLNLLDIPSAISSIESNAFKGCSNLTQINVYPHYPIDLSTASSVFSGIDLMSCTLLVPYGSKDYYNAANQWKDFKNIVESGNGRPYLTGDRILRFNACENNTSVYMNYLYFGWSSDIYSDQDWLNVEIDYPNKSDSLKLIIKANTTSASRTANVIYCDNIKNCLGGDYFLTVKQEGLFKTLTIKSGGLSSALTKQELIETGNLMLSGTIDARDFKTMRDEMPNLAELDLSGVIIESYSGEEGTSNGNSNAIYIANEIPKNAFLNKWNGIPSSVNLPISLKSIGDSAFFGCTSLTSVQIPLSVTSIGNSSFYYCYSLDTISIPSSVILLGQNAFSGCGTTFVKNGNPKYSTIDGVLFNKEQTSLIHYSCSKPGDYKVPTSVITIEESAFQDCYELESVVILSSVNLIGNQAFNRCWSLKSIFANSTVPVDLSSSRSVFTGIDKNICTLYVPYGAKELYSTADQWKDFKNIVEMTTGTEDLQWNIAHFSCYPNPFTEIITIEIQNPKRTEITVDIYNLAGERIKNLATIRKDEKFDLTWNGTNDIGQKVAPGIYICKMNNLSKQLVLLK